MPRARPARMRRSRRRGVRSCEDEPGSLRAARTCSRLPARVRHWQLALRIAALPCAQDRGKRSPADPETPALIAEQEAVPAHDPRIAGRGQREARDARARDDADTPAERQRARVGRDGIVGQPHLGRSGRVRNEGAQSVGGDGIGRRRGEPEDGPVDPIEFAKPPGSRHGVRPAPGRCRPRAGSRPPRAASRPSESRRRVPDWPPSTPRTRITRLASPEPM